MIFNKQGPTLKKHKFYFQGKEIEIVEQYTYLGFTFISSSKKHKGIENLLKNASKAWFKPKKRHLTLTYILLKQLLSQLHFTLAKNGAIATEKAKLK